jgi:creatinine amidohydrolase
VVGRNASGRLVADFGALTPEELAPAVAENAIVYLPLGSVEWHNNQLPFDTDSIIADGLCRRLAEETGGLTLPVNPWATACTFFGRGPYVFPPATGTVALFDADLFRRLLRGIARGVVDNGLRRLALVAGHVGRDDREAMEQTAAEVNAEGAARALFLYPYAFTRGDHAGHWETLMVMGLRPDVVRHGRRYIEYSHGTPLTGEETEEEGRRKIAEAVAGMAGKVREFFGLTD